jgi:hypothetical protein
LIFLPIVEGIMENLGGRTSGTLTGKEKLAELGRKSVLVLDGRRFGRLVVVCRAGSGWKKAMWFCRCDCGEEKVVCSRALVSGRTKSCGCYHREVWQKVLKNPLLTDEDREQSRQRRIDPRNIEWRNAVYERDNFVCRVCGDTRGGNLVAHHKESWNKDREKRFDVENGVTCCVGCHKEFHSLFGYGENTAEEWSLFLKSKGVGGTIFDRPVRRRIRVDLTGKRFGRLVVCVLDITKRTLHWVCRCDCGKIKSVDGHGLKRGSIASCGCLQKDMAGAFGRKNLNDLKGKRFGRLVAVEYVSKHRWRCVCDCENVRIVDAKFLHNGTAVDCQSMKNGNKCRLRRAT